MQKKQKIFYLDFIRVVSMLIIVTYHFYAHFAENNISGVRIPLSDGKWGVIGVALFFVISGASLMYNYGEKIDIKKYFIKRFFGIYPMFWLAYSILFIYLFYQVKGVPTAVPVYKLLFSVVGMDGYLNCYTETIYLLGEWFLGCIILIYLLFPLLRLVVNKYPKTTLVVATVLNFIVSLFHKNGIMSIDKNLILSVYSFLLGMYVINIKRIQWWQAIVGVLLAMLLYKLPTANINIQVLYARLAAYLLFIFFVYVGQKINNNMLQMLFEIISKYSYAIFLVHHFLIMKVLNTFQGATFGIAGTILLYLTCWGYIIVFAKLLYELNKAILKLLKAEKK